MQFIGELINVSSRADYIYSIWANYIDYYVKPLLNFISQPIIKLVNPYWNKIYRNTKYLEYFMFTLLGCVLGYILCYISMTVFWMLSFLPWSVSIAVITSICTIIFSSISMGSKYVMNNTGSIIFYITRKYPGAMAFLTPVMMFLYPSMSLQEEPPKDIIDSNDTKPNLNIVTTKNGVANIQYYHNDKTHNFYIPTITNKRIIRHVKSKKVVAIYKGKKGLIQKEDITQEHMMPHIITASDLGCEEIQVLNLNDEVVSTFTGDDKIVLTQTTSTLIES